MNESYGYRIQVRNKAKQDIAEVDTLSRFLYQTQVSNFIIFFHKYKKLTI